MAGQCKRYSSALKVKVSLEDIKGQKTTNEIAAEHGEHPTQITQWKKQAADGLPNLFSSRESRQAKGEEVSFPISTNKSANSKCEWTGWEKIKTIPLSRNGRLLSQGIPT